MRILYVSRAILPSETSNSLSIIRVCQAFADKGHEVLLSGIRHRALHPNVHAYYDTSRDFDVTTLYVPAFVDRRKHWREGIYARKARRLAERWKPDLIYSRLCQPELEELPGDIPVVFEMHSPGPVGRSEKSRTQFERFLERKNVVRLVVTTNALQDYLRERYPDMDVCLARLSAPRPEPLALEPLAAFKRDNLRGRQSFDVGYTGFLDDKGLRGTEIICQMAERVPEADFHVVGGTPEMVAHWSAQSAAPNLHFYGHRNPAEMPGFLGSFDVVVAPLQLQISARAPFGANMSPLKLPQYFAYGCAIIASDIPCHLEILEHGWNALICKADDAEEWSGAVRRLKSHPGLRTSLGQAAREDYEKRHTPSIRTQTILAGLEPRPPR